MNHQNFSIRYHAVMNDHVLLLKFMRFGQEVIRSLIVIGFACFHIIDICPRNAVWALNNFCEIVWRYLVKIELECILSSRHVILQYCGDGTVSRDILSS